MAPPPSRRGRDMALATTMQKGNIDQLPHVAADHAAHTSA